MKTSLPLALTISTVWTLTDALKSYVARLPNGANVVGVPAVGHADEVGAKGPLNSFGKDFSKAGHKWTTSLCHADSDGDGRTNGEELGDPCCVWKVGDIPAFTSGVSNPGNPGTKVSGSKLVNITCPSVAPSSPSTPVAPQNLVIIVFGVIMLVGALS